MLYYSGSNPKADVARTVDPADAAALDEIGKRIGYGRAQQALQFLWAQELERQGLPTAGALFRS